MPRPQLSPGTSHTTTKYEVEVLRALTGQWYLNYETRDLQAAHRWKDGLILTPVNPEARIVVVSETRRLIDEQ